MDNNTWSNHLIDQLVCQGISRFCIAPGSRSTPLALAAARHPEATITVHPDERGLGFFALGCSLGSKQCTAVITTSGSAVGNLMPSIMEAKHSSAPLLYLTADRPPELRDCGANQTTDQVKIFESFLEWQTDLPCPDASSNANFIRSQASFAVERAMQGKGPVQINCQFREPLFCSNTLLQRGTKQYDFPPSEAPTKEQLSYVLAALQSAKRGLILIGRMPAGAEIQPILDLAKDLNWPIFADILSQARSSSVSEQIFHFDYAIRANSAPPPDCILYFGGSFVSKFLFPWIQREKSPLIHIHYGKDRIDTNHLRPARIHADPAAFCRQLNRERKTESSWLEIWKNIDRILEDTIDSSCLDEPSFVEPHIIRKIAPLLSSNTSLFLANSMPIRDATHFCTPAPKGPIYCNRGLSGIDGQIATAAGVATATKTPLVALLGDQSCLHDLNSCLFLQNIKTPFLLLISNNFGGGIFSYVEAAKEEKHFDTLFAASHSIQFEGIAKMLNLPYSSSKNLDALNTLFSHPGPQILEIFTSRKKNTCFQKRILEKCCLMLQAKRLACSAKF